MNRSLDARMDRIERAIGAAREDEFGLSELSHDDLSPYLHDVASRIAANESGMFAQEEVDAARATLANLEAEVRDQIEFRRRPEIAAAIASNNAAGLNGKPWHSDWEGLAREWGLLDVNGNLIMKRAANEPLH